MSNNVIRVALAGVGSCASSFVQSVVLDRERPGPSNGVMHEYIGGHRLGDVEFVAAFDVDALKVGQDLSEAVYAGRTAAVRHVDVPHLGVTVQAGPLLDGLDGALGDAVDAHLATAVATPESLAAALAAARPDVVVCLLPTGSTEAVQTYARAAAEAGAGFVNATPEPVANDPALVALFTERGVPLLGDDLRSHLGATTLHTALIELFQSRGVEVKDNYQLNVGGNTDFLNLSDPARSHSKQVSKRKALANAGIDSREVAAGPNGFVKHLGDRKVCFLRIEGESIIGAPVHMELRLEVEDSPNAAAVLANAVRAAHSASRQGMVGIIDPVCAFLFKSPRTGAKESEALHDFQGFVRKAGEHHALQAVDGNA
ncbi:MULTISPECIES: inositol-3-phosphate synthase [unclassified Streptomyces]|uniref:inositol-3-phosphate synthase n=1 Tax=unclassified Streptomyces TaxID=2593676 RepID=UPI0009405188|nr:inositol-3-phosphate synthase [Streptomyces sp. CB02400]OKK13565.1 myo-inositol-1-phosphate synthase [Streptomyces sp. CB02400]